MMDARDIPITERLSALGYSHEDANTPWMGGSHVITDISTGEIIGEMDAMEAAKFCTGAEIWKARNYALLCENSSLSAQLDHALRAAYHIKNESYGFRMRCDLLTAEVERLRERIRANGGDE